MLFDRPLLVMSVKDFGKIDNFLWCIFPSYFTKNMCSGNGQACCEQDVGLKTCQFQKGRIQEMLPIRIRTRADALKSQIYRIKSTVDMQFYVISIL